MSDTVYDQVRYPGKFYPQSSVDHLATLARLHGLQPAAPQACRVLELGCGDGGNLIPQAAAFPGSTFVGIDLAASAIEAGQAVIERLGLRNIELIAADIAAFQPSGAPFDYVVSHGVLSWVPEPVRQRLLQLCGECLAAQGVAYVSYSALPGGYLRNVPRDLMRFHTRRIDEPQHKAVAAREAVAFVMSAMPSASIGRDLLEREMAGSEGKDFFLLHDLLADENEPLYFLDFVDAAGAVGLQYLSEAEVSSMSTANFPPLVRQRLDGMTNRLEREQYLDFIHLRRFRQTLLCRAGLPLDLAVSAERLQGLYFASSARPVAADASAHAPGSLEFRHPQWGSYRADEPLAKALGLALARADPCGSTFEQLRQATLDELGATTDTAAVDDAALIRHLLSLYARDMLAIHSTRWSFCREVSARPCVSPLARLLAASGAPVVNAALGTFYLPSEPLRRLVTLLDGSRGHDELLDELAGLLPRQEQPNLTLPTLRRRLQLLADNAMLIA